MIVCSCGRLSVLMNVDDSRGSIEWRKVDVLVNVAEWNMFWSMAAYQYPL